MKRIKAEKIRVSDTIVFKDARFNFVVEDIREQFSGSFVRGIIIHTDSGEEVELVLFSRNSAGALEPVSEAMEDWK